jgi:nicotinate-nucleotide pyrophosphorylase (carboxylating)
MSLDIEKIRPLVRLTLKEDLGHGDITSKWTVPKQARALGLIMTKEDAVIAGLPVAKLVFELVDQTLSFQAVTQDGARLGYGAVLAQIQGSARSILAGERVALNFLQHLSGVATLTSKYVAEVQGTSAKILDTRKTLPGLRYLEKYAVRMGGGTNHRMGLYDMVLIKSNHAEMAGGIANAVRKIKRLNGKGTRVVAEVRNLNEATEALFAGPDRLLLDNMSLDKVREVVALVAASNQGREAKTETEVSGGVNLDTIRAIAQTGVDYISVGALTHSVQAIDLSLSLRELGSA